MKLFAVTVGIGESIAAQAAVDRLLLESRPAPTDADDDTPVHGVAATRG